MTFLFQDVQLIKEHRTIQPRSTSVNSRGSISTYTSHGSMRSRSDTLTEETSSISARSDTSIDSCLFDPQFGNSIWFSVCPSTIGWGKMRERKNFVSKFDGKYLFWKHLMRRRKKCRENTILNAIVVYLIKSWFNVCPAHKAPRVQVYGRMSTANWL